VPYFEDIPVLGHLFRKDGERRRRTNLLIFITPRILKDQFDARDATLAKRDKVESVIEQNGTEPDRGEVLHSEDLDRVAEMLPSRTVSTTPITPAAGSAKAGEDGGAVARTQQRLMMLHEAPPAATAPSDRGAVPEYTVQPKLPNTSGKERAESRAGRPQGDEAMSGDAPAKAPQPRGGASYVVFRSKKGGTVGLVVPSSVATFFQSGGRYKERDESYICLGRYSSKEAATTSHTALQSWRELSPRESLQLGEGAWRRG
jgi:hypothetical protein